MIPRIIEIGDKDRCARSYPAHGPRGRGQERTAEDSSGVFRSTATPDAVVRTSTSTTCSSSFTPRTCSLYTLRAAQKFDMDKMLRPIEFTPEQKKSRSACTTCGKKVHMIIVVDEYGGHGRLGHAVGNLLAEIVERDS